MLSTSMLVVCPEEGLESQTQQIDEMFANGVANYTIAKHREVCTKIQQGAITVTELRQSFADALASQDLVKQELNRWKLDKLKRLLYYPRGKKQDVIEQILEAMLREFAINQSVIYTVGKSSKDSYLNAIKKAVGKVSQADLEKEAAEYAEKAAFKQKASTNPQTREEFEYFVGRFGENKLSSEQKALWDELRATSTLEKQEIELAKKAIVSKVKLEAVEFNLVEHYHSKRGHNVFTVTLSGRVDKDTFNELCQKARMLEGNYAKPWRDKVNNTVSPGGFTFNEKEQAQKFMQLKEGNVSRLDQLQERKEEVKANAVEHLAEVAENLSEKATEVLTRDKKVNTVRRARMAKSAKTEAREDLQLAQTIARIVQAIENGQSKFLTGVRAKTHIETLEEVLDDAKYERRKKLGQRYEDIKHEEPELADVDFVEYPYPTLNLGQLTKVSEKKIKGLTLVTNRLTKLFTIKERQLGYVVIKAQSLIKDLQKMVYKTKMVDTYLAEMVADKLANYQRLQLIGLTDTPTLRAALREYMLLRTNTLKADPIEEMERELIGCTIDGYFPTPPNVVEQMLDLADIKPDMTILEPQAGKGNISSLIREYYPNTKLDVIEINSRLREILKAKNFNIVGYNFLQHQQSYDRILMNPPFENLQDIKHTQYAYNLLNPGGRLVAVMSESPFFRMDKEAVAFRSWLDEVNGSSEKLPQGSFLNSERSTGVATRIVVINKPNANPTNTNFNENLSEAKELTPEPIQNVSILPEAVELDSPKEVIEDQENILSISTLVTKNITEEKHFDGILDTDEYQALKDNFLEHQQTYQMIMMDALLPIGQDIKYVYHAYSLLDIGGSLVAKMPQTTFAPSNRVYAEFRRWLKSINATTTKLSEDNVCLVYITKNTLF